MTWSAFSLAMLTILTSEIAKLNAPNEASALVRILESARSLTEAFPTPGMPDHEAAAVKQNAVALIDMLEGVIKVRRKTA